MKLSNQPASTTPSTLNGKSSIVLFTDPLCCWSWAVRAAVEQLQADTAAVAEWEVKMGGLIPNWENYYDASNSVTSPAQMGPIWMHAGILANQPIQHQVWHRDPPASSYPACVAVKCAQLQSVNAGQLLLWKLWDACMLKGQNIARPDVILTLAASVAKACKDFSVEAFTANLHNGSGIAAFKADLAAAYLNRITRFPSLLIKAGQQTSLIAGFRDSDRIVAGVKKALGLPV